MFHLTNYLGDSEARVLWQNGPQVQTGLSRDLDPAQRSFAIALLVEVPAKSQGQTGPSTWYMRSPGRIRGED